MEKRFSFDFWHYDSFESMTEADQLLVEQAKEMTSKAYAPYSNFSVGAAARLASGKVIYGSNVESEVYPAGLCAERTLLYHAQSQYADDPIEALAIASNPNQRECYPCGQCRQVLMDTERRQGSAIRIIMSGDDSATVVASASDLLPFTFQL